MILPLAALAVVTLHHPHPLYAHACRVETGWYGDPARPETARRLGLYHDALRRGAELRQGTFTAYHPHEGPIGGGPRTALGDDLVSDSGDARTDIAASAIRHFRRGARWINAELWIEDWGYVKVRDCGGGWRAREQFDLCQRTVGDVNRFGKQRRRFVVLTKPPPLQR